MAVDNPRWPHSCVVTRTENLGDEATPNMTAITVLASVCRNSVSGKGMNRRSVYESEFTVSLPFHSVSVLAGDSISVTDRVRTIQGIVVEASVHNFGANIYYIEQKN
jgi:hypothetical protein